MVKRSANLARQMLASELPGRWQHVAATARQAARLAAAAGFGPLAQTSAWLHDIGYAADLVQTGFHPIDGARFLRREGWEEDVVCLVAYHSCAVVEADARGLGEVLRSEFRDEPSDARDVLWAADATTGPTGELFTVEQRVAEVLARYGADHQVSRCMLIIQPELQAAVDRVSARWATSQPR